MPHHSTDTDTTPHPDADALSRVRNATAAVADALRRRDRHSNSDVRLRAFAAFERACEATRSDDGLPSEAIRAAIREGVTRPERLKALREFISGLNISEGTDPIYELIMALRPVSDD